ncbi:copper amine oxidase N-terminal domain-containing protein [Cohnella terricola]|uniref:copper amine oxidase N-terminal domain-containing protein n=1 Tax=Cohnella terricola TaxID=1289167 RepID=UPI0016481918|nr:copper amine oxidase N-terminal domain-containing protein [Cohnella terricola]
MRKLLASLTAFAIVFSAFNQPQDAKAESPIRIFIDGQILATDQDPVAIAGYTMVPLRGIFEALNARVQWNQKAQTVTATKRDTTVVLTLGAKTATINNKVVTLDSPARAIHGRTMVPVRFVSEALGDDVAWDKLSQSVLITTKAVKEVGAASSLSVSTVSQYGDGRDLQVSFAPPSDQSNVDSYRILVVKAENASSFNLANAQSVSSSNYTAISKSTQRTTLSSQSRDVDGALLRTNQSYRVFVLTLGKDSYALSSPSVSISLSAIQSVNAATNVKIESISDLGDGRDMRVTFTKASNESNITGYRVMIVKSSDASRFDLTAANGMSSSYYTSVSKTGNNNTLSVTLNSAARDTSGALIRNGEAYTAFVLALSSNTGSMTHALSAGSASVTLGTSPQTPRITGVADIDDNGDGRDLQVTFNKASDESRIVSYRIFVVRESDFGSFNLTEANKTSYFYDQYKTGGSNYSVTLTSNMRDVKGNSVTNGIAYRVFVMGVSNNSAYPNTLSASSDSITLSYSGISAVTNVFASDVNDYNNGRDLQISFTKVVNESLIKNYRVFVVKEAYAASFNLAAANAVTNSNNYTTFNKTNANIIQTLNATSRDVDGALIQNGTPYRVFVMTVGNGSNALSAASNPIMLSSNNVTAITNLAVSDVGDYGDGRGLKVSFTKAANETNIAHYRVFVVKENAVNYFNLNYANASNYYTVINKTGSNIVGQSLNADSRDIDGALIQNSINYKVFVLSVGTSTAYGNALSAASSTIKLTNKGTVTAVTNIAVSKVSDYGDGRDLKVSFTKASPEANISHYRIFVVPEAAANQFNLNAANAISDSRLFTVANIGSDYNQPLLQTANDIYYQPIQNGMPYRVFVLSVGYGVANGTNALSLASPSITLTSTGVPAVTGVVASANNGTDLQVSFNKASDETNISHYRMYVVKENSASGFTANTAMSITDPARFAIVNKTGNSPYYYRFAANAVDTDGAPIVSNVGYRVFVVSVANNGLGVISPASNPVTLVSTGIPVQAVTGIQAVQVAPGTINVSFTAPTGEFGISQYAVFVTQGALQESLAIDYFKSGNASLFTNVYRNGQNGPYSVNIASSITGQALVAPSVYQVYVLSIADQTNATLHKLSVPASANLTY